MLAAPDAMAALACTTASIPCFALPGQQAPAAHPVRLNRPLGIKEIKFAAM
jgi:hypothetical protein